MKQCWFRERKLERQASTATYFVMLANAGIQNTLDNLVPVFTGMTIFTIGGILDLLQEFKSIYITLIKLSLVLIVLFSSSAAMAGNNELVLEGGLGFYKSYNSKAAFFRYQRYVSPFYGLDSYYSLAVADWSGPTHNSAILLTKGFRWNITDMIHFDFEGGGAYLRRTTDNLGTRAQFTFRAALGVKVKVFDIGVSYNHFSNGKGVFGWTKTSNISENFIMLQLGYLF
jgi:hypothetical protein